MTNILKWILRIFLIPDANTFALDPRRLEQTWNYMLIIIIAFAFVILAYFYFIYNPKENARRWFWMIVIFYILSMVIIDVGYILNRAPIYLLPGAILKNKSLILATTASTLWASITSLIVFYLLFMIVAFNPITSKIKWRLRVTRYYPCNYKKRFLIWKI